MDYCKSWYKYCFNPCFNGCATATPKNLMDLPLKSILHVSILVLMDVPLQLYTGQATNEITATERDVSILVLMDVPLQHMAEKCG